MDVLPSAGRTVGPGVSLLSLFGGGALLIMRKSLHFNYATTVTGVVSGRDWKTLIPHLRSTHFLNPELGSTCRCPERPGERFGAPCPKGRTILRQVFMREFGTGASPLRDRASLTAR